MKRYWSEIGYVDLCILWGFKIPMKSSAIYPLYVRVNGKGLIGEIHSYSQELDREKDVIMNRITSVTRTMSGKLNISYSPYIPANIKPVIPEREFEFIC